MKATSIALLLLLSITACSKKEDSTPEPAPNTGSYTIDGRATTGSAKAYYRLSTTGTDDQLTIVLTATPPGVGTETTTLILTKALGTPESAYQVQTLNLNHGPGKPYYNYTANVLATVTKTSTGSYSGTFSGFSPSTSPNPASTLTQGVFTNVSL